MNESWMADIGALSDKGLRREVNEDSFAIPPTDLPPEVLARKGYLYVVADGIGGHTAGKAASDLTVRVVMQQYYADPSADVGRSLVGAIQAANAEVYRGAQDAAFANMGTTIVAAVVRGNSLTVAHVGDSRAYLVRGGTMQSLTQDHTWVAEQVRNGLITSEQASQHEQRHVLIRSLGRQPQVAVDVSQRVLYPGDRLLLCSDGLWEFATATDIQRVLSSQPPRAAAQQLINLANLAGGPDNITAIVIKPAVTRAPSPLSEPASRVQGVLSELHARFLALPDQARLLVLVAAAVLLLAGCAGLAAGLFSKPLPSVPAVQVAPVSYVVLSGDTQEAIVNYFRTTTQTLTANPVTGQPVTLMPGGYALLFSGQVVRIRESDGVRSMEVANRAKRYAVRVDPRADGVSISADAAPQEGNTVTVIARPSAGGEGEAVEALVADVWQGDRWATWYFRSPDSDVWVYSAFHDQLVPAGEAHRDLEGRQALLLGRWSQTPAGVLFTWGEQDLFLLEDGELYVSRVPAGQRQSLAVRFPPAETPVPSDGGETDGPAASASPTAAPSPTGVVSGTVTSAVGAFVRKSASSGSEEIGVLEYGAQVQIHCQRTGQEVDGNATWYYIIRPGVQSGYVSATLVDLAPGHAPEDIDACP